VIVCMILKVGKLVACWEDTWLCSGGGGGLLGSIFSLVVGELVAGYVICMGAKG
jgi:hypothetical protein